MRQGFTLVEALVTIGIMMVMAGVLLAYNRSSEGQLAFTVSQAKLVGALTRAKSFALQKYAGGLATSDACAFGVHLDTTAVPIKAIIFQDLPRAGEGCVDDSGIPTFSRKYDGSGETVETVTFDGRVVINPPVTPGDGDVVFEAPYLKMYLDNAPSMTARFTARLVNGGVAQDFVTVGPGGDITAQ